MSLTIQEAVRAEEKFLMLPHPLTNLETQRYYQNGRRFNDVYLRKSLSENVKDWGICNKCQ